MDYARQRPPRAEFPGCPPALLEWLEQTFPVVLPKCPPETRADQALAALADAHGAQKVLARIRLEMFRDHPD